MPTAEERQQLGRCPLWTAWVASANRPGTDHGYTNSWPPDRSVGNVATAETCIWTLGGIISLFVTLGLVIFWVHRDKLWYGEAHGVPLAERLIDAPLTSSRLKTARIFPVVILLFLVQTAFGGLLALTLLALFPVGITQAWTSCKEGLRVARDVSFFELSFASLFGHVRMNPDTVIIVVGVLPLVYSLFRTLPHLKAKQIANVESVWKQLGVEL